MLAQLMLLFLRASIWALMTSLCCRKLGARVFGIANEFELVELRRVWLLVALG